MWVAARGEREACMELTKDVFLSDDRAPYLVLALASRDLAAHSLLTGLPAEERARVHAVLAVAAAAIVELLGPAWERHAPSAGTDTFGCGT